MEILRSSTRTRRQTLRSAALAGGVAALGIGGALPGSVGAQPRFGVGGGGLAGGGTVASENGDAQFSIFATRITLPGEKEEQVIGQVRWVDGDVALTSLAVDDYGPLEGDKRARRLVGTMSANGEGSYPFTLTVVDGGEPGTGLDTLSLTVGAADAATPVAVAADDFAYDRSDAALTGGDLQLLDLTALFSG